MKVVNKSNPADAASRGLTARELVEDDYNWLKGPTFLRKPGAYKAQVDRNPQALDSSDPEVKRVSLVTQANDAFPDYFEMYRLNRFSNWFSAKRAVAACLRFKQCLKEMKEVLRTNPSRFQLVNVEKIGQAETEIIRSLQYEHFKDEIKTILQNGGEFHDRKSATQRNVNLKKCTCLYRLDTFLDSAGVLHVGGCLRRAIVSENVKHPVILPRKSHVTNLILQYCHEKTRHQGNGMTTMKFANMVIG